MIKTIKQKIQTYYHLQKEIKKTEKFLSEKRNQQSEIFLSSFKTNDIYMNASCVFDFLFTCPKEKFWSGFVIFQIQSGNYGIYWSKETLEKQTYKILNSFVKEKILIKLKNGWYKISPRFRKEVKNVIS